MSIMKSIIAPRPTEAGGSTATATPAPSSSSDNRYRVRMTRREFEGIRSHIANPEPPTAELRALFTSQEHLADNEI